MKRTHLWISFAILVLLIPGCSIQPLNEARNLPDIAIDAVNFSVVDNRLASVDVSLSAVATEQTHVPGETVEIGINGFAVRPNQKDRIALFAVSRELAFTAPADTEATTETVVQQEINDYLAREAVSVPFAEYQVEVELGLLPWPEGPDRISENNVLRSTTSTSFTAGSGNGVIPDVVVQNLSMESVAEWPMSVVFELANEGAEGSGVVTVGIDARATDGSWTETLLEETVDNVAPGAVLNATVDAHTLYLSAYTRGVTALPAGEWELAVRATSFLDANSENNVTAVPGGTATGVPYSPLLTYTVASLGAPFGTPLGPGTPLVVELWPEEPVEGTDEAPIFTQTETAAGTFTIALKDLLAAGASLSATGRYRFMISSDPTSALRYFWHENTGPGQRAIPSLDFVPSGQSLVQFGDGMLTALDAGRRPDAIAFETPNPLWAFAYGDEDVVLAVGMPEAVVDVPYAGDRAIAWVPATSPGYRRRLLFGDLNGAATLPSAQGSGVRLGIEERGTAGSIAVEPESGSSRSRYEVASPASEEAFVLLSPPGRESGTFGLSYQEIGPSWPQSSLGYPQIPDPVGAGTLASPELLTAASVVEFSPPVGATEYVLFMTAVSPGATMRVWIEDATSPSPPDSHADVAARVEVDPLGSGTWIDITDQATAIDSGPARETPEGYRIDDPFLEPARIPIPSEPTTLVRVIVSPYGGGAFEDPPGPDPEQTFRFVYDYE